MLSCAVFEVADKHDRGQRLLESTRERRFAREQRLLRDANESYHIDARVLSACSGHLAEGFCERQLGPHGVCDGIHHSLSVWPFQGTRDMVLRRLVGTAGPAFHARRGLESAIAKRWSVIAYVFPHC